MRDILSIYTPEQLIDGNLVLQGLFTFSYFISSMFVYHNTYGGFNAVFLGAVYALFIIFTYHGVRKSINRTNYGAILAASLFLVFISLESAIFWGQYSGCGKINNGGHHLNEPLPNLPPSSDKRLPSQPYDGNLPPSPNFRSLYTYPGNEYDAQCRAVPAMKSVCAFSVFMFLAYIAQVFLLLRFKDDILGNGPLNEGYAPVARDDHNQPNASSIPTNLPSNTPGDSKPK